MRISEHSMSGVERTVDGQKPSVKAATQPSEAAASVQIGAASNAVSDRTSQSAAARAERVQKIAASVRSGSYPVDLKKLSRAIASDEMSRAG